MQRMNGILGVVVSSVAVLVVVLVGWFVFVSPQRSKADKLSAQVAAADSELAADQALLTPNARRETRVAARSADLALPDKAEMSNILRELHGFAKKSKTEIESITPGTPTAVGAALALPISLQFKGRYFGLKTLLQLLRTSADVHNGALVATGRLYTVDGIQFTGGQASSNGQTSSTGDITAVISLNAFTYSGAAAATATSATTQTTAAAPTP